MTRESLDYMDDIIEAMENALAFVEGMDYGDFIKDTKTVYAVIRCIEIIGEAVKGMPDEIKASEPGISWRNIAGMRDKLIHGYFGVEPERVWQVVRRDIPALKPVFEELRDRTQTERGEK